MKEILKEMVAAIDSFDITATAENLKKEYPNLSMAAINKMLTEKLGLLGASQKQSYIMLIDSIELNERNKERHNEEIRRGIRLLLMQMFYEAIKQPQTKLVDTFNDCVIQESQSPKQKIKI